jgi:hypothetical protein
MQGKHDPVFGGFNDVCAGDLFTKIIRQDDIQAWIFFKGSYGQVDAYSPSIRPGLDSQFSDAHILRVFRILGERSWALK